MTIVKVRSEVSAKRLSLSITMLIACTAAFLTQTVTLSDQTTVKFEIWYVLLMLSSPLRLNKSLPGTPQVKNVIRQVPPV
jgi:hypothetical protein